MNLVFIYLGEECLVIIYSVSELAMGKVPVCLQPGTKFRFTTECSKEIKEGKKM